MLTKEQYQKMIDHVDSHLPLKQLMAFEWIDSNGLDLIGNFHSHPIGPETVSPTDMAEAAFAVVHVILANVDRKWHV